MRAVTELFSAVLDMSLTASVMILVVLLSRLALRRAPRVCSYALWSVVLFRLLCPFSVSGALSLLSLAKPVLDTAGVSYGSVPGLTRLEYFPAEPSVAAGGSVPPSQGAPLSGADMELIASLIWLAVALILLLRALVNYLRLRQRLRDSEPLEKGVYLARHAETAFVAGIISPKIYLPRGLSESEAECVLAHERRHIRRGDHIIKPLAYLALCLHWFNPLVWLAWVLAMRDMETSCDAAALRSLGSGARAEYAQTLLNIAAGRRAEPALSLSFGEDAKRRIEALAKLRPAKLWISAAAAALALTVVAGCAVNPFVRTPGERIAELEKVLEEDTPVSVSLRPVQPSEDAGHLARMEGQRLYMYDYSAPGANAVALAGFELVDGEWRSLMLTGSLHLSEPEGVLMLSADDYLGSGFGLSLLNDGAGSIWEAPDFKAPWGDIYTVDFDGGSFMSGELIPVAIQLIIDPYNTHTISASEADFHDPAALARYEAAYVIALCFRSEPEL